MIKFFRKIRYNLMGKGKTGKYLKYAIGEIILVVIGILIALQINTWNENRKQKVEELETLKNIKSEFKNAIQEFEELNAFRERIISSTETLYKIIHTGKNPYSKTQLDSLTSELFINPTYNGQAETLNILFYSGKINIISNDSIKKYLVQWPQLVEDVTEDEVYSSNFLFNDIQPIIKKHVSLHDIYSRIRYKRYQLFNHKTNSSFVADYERLLNDSQFEGALAARELPISVSRLQTEELIVTAKEILRLIDLEITKGP
ncbi:DUF6090 family protein [Winogradskyella ursingii]|uniref:DUF6090 family protein n=1 Tax=Winogradskyella ursingii TaxID=2686079 RepID=UPI0015C7D853|nr:DUF6090 family protein [Winogradskyella ursingii]